MGDAPCRRPCPSLVGDPAAEEWSPWSVCSLTCGQGLQVRTRSCVSSPYGTLCSGPLRETRPCNNSATCPGMPVLPAQSACRVGSCLGLGQVHLPKMVGCLFLSFSKLDCPPNPHTGPSPTQGIRDTDESDQGPHQQAWFWAHHSPDAYVLVIKACLFTLTAFRVPCALATPAPLALSHRPALAYSHPIPSTSTLAIKIQPVLQDLKEMPLKKKK